MTVPTMLIGVLLLDAVKSNPNSPHFVPVPLGSNVKGSDVLPAVATTETGPCVAGEAALCSVPKLKAR